MYTDKKLIQWAFSVGGRNDGGGRCFCLNIKLFDTCEVSQGALFSVTVAGDFRDGMSYMGVGRNGARSLTETTLRKLGQRESAIV